MNIWNLKQLIKDRPSSFKEVSQENLESMRAVLTENWIYRHSGHLWRAMQMSFVVAGLISYVVMLMSGYKPHMPTIMLPILLALICFGGYVFGTLFSLLLGDLFSSFVIDFQRIAYNLKPLSDTDSGCERAIHLLNFQLSKEYRDSVVAEGRELVCLDLEIMEKLAYEEKTQLEKAKRHELCMQLHTGLLEL